MKKKNIIWAIALSGVSVLSLLLAVLFNLQYNSSAAIIAMLAMITLKSKENIFKVILNWYITVAIATLSAFLFEVFGYGLLILFIVLILFLSSSLYLDMTECMVISTVIITHYFGNQNMSIENIFNEFSLLTIGILASSLTTLGFRKIKHSEKIYN